MAVIRDLFRFSPSFRIGATILVLVLGLAALSFFSPYEPDDRRAVARNEPPSQEFIFGTTSTGQDVFWILTFAVRNSLLIGSIAVVIGRSIGVLLGMISGYLGGAFDRIASSMVDTFIVIPRLPLVILVASILRGELTIIGLAVLLGLLDWAHPSKRYRSQILSLREREFTYTGIFAGMSTLKIVTREHLPFLIPFLMADVVSGFIFAIGFEVTLAVLGLGDLNAPTVGTMIYWGNYYQSLLTNRTWVLIPPIATSVVIVIGFYLVSISFSTYLDPRTRLARLQVQG